MAAGRGSRLSAEEAVVLVLVLEEVVLKHRSSAAVSDTFQARRLVAYLPNDH